MRRAGSFGCGGMQLLRASRISNIMDYEISREDLMSQAWRPLSLPVPPHPPKPKARPWGRRTFRCRACLLRTRNDRHLELVPDIATPVQPCVNPACVCVVDWTGVELGSGHRPRSVPGDLDLSLSLSLALSALERGAAVRARELPPGRLRGKQPPVARNGRLGRALRSVHWSRTRDRSCRGGASGLRRGLRRRARRGARWWHRSAPRVRCCCWCCQCC